MGDTGTKGNIFNDPDYKILAEKFQKDLDEAMSAYRRGMETTIIPQAKYFLSGYLATVKTLNGDSAVVDATRDTEVSLKAVETNYETLIRSVLDHVLGSLSNWVIITEIRPTTELCASKTDTKNVKAYSMTAFDWYGHKTYIQPQFCLLYGPEIYNKKEHQSQGDVSLYENGLFVKKTWSIDDFSMQNYHGPINDFEIAMTSLWTQSDIQEWFNSPDPRTDYASPIPIIIQQINSTWLQGCHSEECRKLRLGDMLKFLTAIKHTLLQPFPLGIKPFTLQIKNSNSTGKWGYGFKSTEVPPLDFGIDELTSITRELMLSPTKLQAL